MTFTSHGHHIPFTFLEDIKPEKVEECGGVRVCTCCTIEAVKYMPAFANPGPRLAFLLAARHAVTEQIRQCLREDGGPDRENYVLFDNVTIAS